MKRKIIRIDEERCDGCGICAEACHEGAIRIVDGKARLVAESYCDGLGDCIGPCPRDAITIEEREAEAYDEEAVRKHLANAGGCPGSCPGSMPVDLDRSATSNADIQAHRPSMLSQWPVQIMLVPPSAPFLREADLLITADCVPFALAGFHEELVRGRIVLVGCPKLDDAEYYLEKLTEMFRLSRPASITVAYMEVPCCGALPRLVDEAVRRSGAGITVERVRIGIRGEVQESG